MTARSIAGRHTAQGRIGFATKVQWVETGEVSGNGDGVKLPLVVVCCRVNVNLGGSHCDNYRAVRRGGDGVIHNCGLGHGHGSWACRICC